MESSDTSENKSLLIIKSQPHSISGVENFLKNRDWKMFSTTTLKDALTFMVQNQPAFVLISVDHPNKKIRKLAKVLPQAFPCCVILFAETTQSASLKSLADAKAEYVLYPPVTGPAVERTVNKFHKDQARKAMEGNTIERGKMGEGDDKVISIKGNSVSAQHLLAQMMNDDGGNLEGVLAGDHTNSLGGMPYDPSHVGHYNPQRDGRQVQESLHRNSTDANAHSGLGPDSQDSQGHNGPAYNPQNPRAQGVDSGALHNPHIGSRNGNGYRPPLEGLEDVDVPHAGSFVPTKPPGFLPLDKKQGPVGPIPSDDELSPRTRHQQDSIILKGTRDALESSVVRTKTTMEQVELIESASNVACIVIDSTRFSGYLVAALGKDKKIDDKFIDKIREKLFKFLSDHGEKVERTEESMQIKIKQVPFEDWAIECAEFLRKSVHNGEEVAMAFFPHPNVKAHFKESASDMMLSISLDDIKADVAVEFNLYVYLPANQKYVLYTPRGGKIYQNQLAKLEAQGISHMHMFKSDAQDFTKYRAQNYLNEKIDEYERGALNKAPVVA